MKIGMFRLFLSENRIAVKGLMKTELRGSTTECRWKIFCDQIDVVVDSFGQPKKLVIPVAE